MLPGDTESISVQVRVGHVEALDVWFQAEISEDSSALSEMLDLRVTDSVSGTVIWQGALGDLNASSPVYVSVPASETGSTVLSWRIEAALPTHAGNEYQSVRCVADLHWYVQGDDQSKLTPLLPAGDGLPPAFLALVLIAAVAVLAVAAGVFRRKHGMFAASATLAAPTGAHEDFVLPSADFRKLGDGSRLRRKGMAVCALTAVGLLVAVVVAWALIWAHAHLPENTFETGSVSLELNGGRPVFPEGSVRLEPGCTAVEEFTVSNTGTAEAYYRVYLSGLRGGLASSLEVTVSRGSSVLYRGSAVGLEHSNACPSDKTLAPGQTDVLAIEVSMAKGSGNNYQGEDVSFDLCVQATQTENNGGREFS